MFNKAQAPANPSSKMSPAMAKAMGGSHAKSVPKKQAASNHMLKPKTSDGQRVPLESQMEQIPQQLMNAPSPLLSQ